MTLSWHNELRHLLFTRDAHHRLWQIAFFSVLVIPLMLTAHRTAADVLCGLIGVLFLVRSASLKDWGWLREPMMLTLFAAWVWMCLVVTPLAYDVKASGSIAFPWIRFLLFFAAMRYWVLTKPMPIKFLGSYLAVWLAIIAVDTFWQYMYGVSLSNNYSKDSGRLTGPFNNVKVGIYLARMLLPAIGICLFFSCMETRKYLAIIAYCGLYFFVLATIGVSGERTALSLTVFSTACILGILIFYEPRVRTLCIAIAAGMTGIIYWLLTTQLWIQERFLATVSILSNFWKSSYGQLYWMAFDIGKTNPITGVGMRNFRELSEFYLAKGLTSHGNLHPHNPYLEWFSEAGSVGLILFLIFVVLVFRHILKHLADARGPARTIAIFALGSVMLLLFPLAPTQSFFANWPAILFWYSLSVSLAMLSLCRREKVGGLT